MRVFIAWSGERSKSIAKAWRAFLPDVIQQTDPFLSENDIGAGERWPVKLNEQLNSTDFGILCLTPENINAPWIHYETGALAKSVDDSRVCPFLFQLNSSDCRWPLAQFQANISDEVGTWNIVQSVNASMQDKSLEESRLRTSFGKHYPDFAKELELVPKKPNSDASTHRSDRQLLEEMLSLARAIRMDPGGKLPWRDKKRKAIVVDVVGGFMDGETLIGDTQRSQMNTDILDANKFYFITDHGQVGRRFQTVTQEAFELMQNENLDNVSAKEKKGMTEEYEVVDRRETPVAIWIKLEKVPSDE